LNLPSWRKWAILVLVSAYGCAAVVLASGLGPIFQVVQASYPGQEKKSLDLTVYPTLFMGIGNLIAMPITGVIGRRSLFLFSILLLVVCSVWAMKSGSLDSHIAARDIMSLAAGQSEALAPMMVQEIHFLHERGRKLAWFIFIENFVVGILFFTSPYMVSAWGWRWWYGFFAIFNAVLLVLSFFLVSETLYPRPEDAPTGEVHLSLDEKGNPLDEGPVNHVVRVTTRHGRILQPEKYGERTWAYDWKLWRVQGSWHDILPYYVDILKGLCHPSLLWLLLLNGAYLGVYVFQASTFAGVLMSPPYLFKFLNLGYVQGAQILCCLVFLPLLGYGSDFIIRTMSRRNNGVYKPEYRLPTLAIPAIAGLVCTIIYGQAAAFPQKWTWSAVAVSYNVIFFAFLGANIVGITYAVDSFPLKAGPVLVVLCAGRGFISFGLSYAVLPAISSIGYNGTMNALAAIGAVFAAMAVPMYFFGPALRRLGQNVYGLGPSKTKMDDGFH
jgi:hypothetical protein